MGPAKLLTGHGPQGCLSGSWDKGGVGPGPWDKGGVGVGVRSESESCVGGIEESGTPEKLLQGSAESFFCP